MKIALTNLERSSFWRAAAVGLLCWCSTINVGLQAQGKRIYTHTADLRSGKEDALLEIFKPISEQFESEYRAVGTAYTAGEVLYQEKRFDDAIRNFDAVVNKGKKYP